MRKISKGPKFRIKICLIFILEVVFQEENFSVCLVNKAFC
jgi:hypothetical protein